VLLQKVGERLVGKLLHGRHAISSELRQLLAGVVVEFDQLSHRQPLFEIKQHAEESFQTGNWCRQSSFHSEGE
jgi:hypothetical protein